MSLCTLYSFLCAASIAMLATVGTLNVQIREYEVPTPRSRPHDPALAPDGSLWYTGQGTNKLGRMDPKTGQFKEYALKTSGSEPHGLVAEILRQQSHLSCLPSNRSDFSLVLNRNDAGGPLQQLPRY